MRSTPLSFASFAVVAALVLLAVKPVAAQGGADGFRAKLEKWVESRRILSEERSEWEADRETLRATRDLLEQEKKTLTEEIAALEASSTEADEERRDLLLRRGEYQRAAGALEARVVEMEREVKQLAARFPVPLQKKLELLLVQIPEDPEQTDQALGQRLMNVLGVLAQAEKWNGTATFVAETRAVDGDQKVQVRTLYWGLAQAIYVDAQGRTAGIGRPGPDGWEFTADADLAPEAQQLLDIYEGNVDTIEFIELPVAIH
jgi:hypothetical protein